MLADRQTEGGQRVEHAGVGFGLIPAVDRTNAVGEEFQRPAGGDRRIQLTDAASRSIAWIDQRLVAARGGSGVVSFQVVAAHVHLAAHFQQRWRLATQAQRDLAQRAQVLRNVLAGGAVATRRTAHQQAVLVAQADRQAIELQFGGIFDWWRALAQLQFAANARVEVQCAARSGIGLGLDRQHRHVVHHRCELRQRLAADALRRRICGQQLGMRIFQRLQFAEQGVIFGVRNARRIVDVIRLVMAFDLGAQPGCAFAVANCHQENSRRACGEPAGRPKVCIVACGLPMNSRRM